MKEKAIYFGIGFALAYFWQRSQQQATAAPAAIVPDQPHTQPYAPFIPDGQPVQQTTFVNNAEQPSGSPTLRINGVL